MIGLRVEEEFHTIIEDARESDAPARTAWKALENMFKSVTIGRKMQLQQQLTNLKMQPGEKVAQYVARAKELKRDLRRADLDDKGVDLTAVCGLLPQFREIRLHIEHTLSENMSLDNALPIVMEHESRLQTDETKKRRPHLLHSMGRTRRTRIPSSGPRSRILRLSATPAGEEVTNPFSVPLRKMMEEDQQAIQEEGTSRITI